MTGKIWAITSYFNPAGYERRRQNYRTFRRNLSVPLLTVELGFDGQYELNENDADLLIQCSDGDVMWQKERLLNIGLRYLPEDCKYVAWLDCDVLFADPAWPDKTVAALEHYWVVQPYGQVFHLPRGDSSIPLNGNRPKKSLLSLGGAIAQGKTSIECWRRDMADPAGTLTPGFAWAAQRELIQQHGFFDAGIVGGGDSALACALFGDFEDGIRMQAMNPQQRRRYLEWARPFHRDAGGRLGMIDGDIYHLWHGEIRHRRYAQRHRELGQFNFDPAADIALAGNGCWRWASDKPALHRHVAEYFVQRREDG